MSCCLNFFVIFLTLIKDFASICLSHFPLAAGVMFGLWFFDALLVRFLSKKNVRKSCKDVYSPGAILNIMPFLRWDFSRIDLLSDCALLETQKPEGPVHLSAVPRRKPSGGNWLAERKEEEWSCFQVVIVFFEVLTSEDRPCGLNLCWVCCRYFLLSIMSDEVGQMTWSPAGTSRDPRMFLTLDVGECLI